jgi:YhcH/YjgK/YiaL family protein
MTTGHINKLGEVLPMASVKKLVDFLGQATSIEPGGWTFFADSHLEKAIVLNKSNYQQGQMEYHRRYADLHITITGTDTIFLSGEGVDITAYDQQGDYALVSVSSFQQHAVPAQNFMLLLPHEIHTNQLAEGALKVVFKVKQNA